MPEPTTVARELGFDRIALWTRRLVPHEALGVARSAATGSADTDTLTASGFTRAQLGAVQQALDNTKRALAAAAPATAT